jgi:hypothetical protein
MIDPKAVEVAQHIEAADDALVATNAEIRLMARALLSLSRRPSEGGGRGPCG